MSTPKHSRYSRLENKRMNKHELKKMKLESELLALKKYREELLEKLKTRMEAEDLKNYKHLLQRKLEDLGLDEKL